jgi:hypothetical protein
MPLSINTIVFSIFHRATGLMILGLIFIAGWGIHPAIAEDYFDNPNTPVDVFSQVIRDLDQIKDIAFQAPSSDSSKSAEPNVCQCCDNNECEFGSAICPHLSHPASLPLACSHDVRSTDVIPPHTPTATSTPSDEEETDFVDEDMINKLKPQQASMEIGIKNYCGQMAKLLSDTLSSPALSPKQKTAAIESAMQLAVVNAQIAAEAKIAQLKAAHESELTVLRGRLLQYSYIESNQQKLYQWLSPIYSNVNRNFQEIEKMTAGSMQLKRCLDIITSQLADQRTPHPKNQWIVTRRNPPSLDQATATGTAVSGQQAVRPMPTSSMDLKTLELRLRNAERLITQLASPPPSQLQSQPQDAMPADFNDRTKPTHRHVSYDRLTPIAPLQPRLRQTP